MAAQQPIDMLDRMVATRYAPLVLPQPLNALPGGDYHKIYLGSMVRVKQLMKSIGMLSLVMQTTKTFKKKMYG